MRTVNGVYASAKIFTDTIEDYAAAQIQMLCDNEAFEDCTVRVMPDVHPGKVGTIGFTSTVGKRQCRLELFSAPWSRKKDETGSGKGTVYSISV